MLIFAIIQIYFAFLGDKKDLSRNIKRERNAMYRFLIYIIFEKFKA